MDKSVVNALDEAERLRGEAEVASRLAAQHAGVEQQQRLEEMANELEAEQVSLRANNPKATGTIEDVFVHRFGREIITNPKLVENYLALGKKIAEAVPTKGKVPVVLVYTTIRRDDIDHTTSLVLVDQKRPFYSSFELEPDQKMHVYTSSRADVTHVELGLLGKQASLNGNLFVPSTVKGYDTRSTGADRLMLNEKMTAADGKGLGMGGTYAFSDTHAERLPDIDDEEWGYDDGRRLLVGWEDIRTAMLESSVGSRNQIARMLYDMSMAVKAWPGGRSSKLMAQVFSTFQDEAVVQSRREALLTDPHLWNRS